MCDFDEGYGSDGRRSPSSELLDERRIQSDSVAFKQRYRIDQLMSNSANGIIYAGVRRSDGKPCVAKQVPRGRAGTMVNHMGRIIPLEFHLHLLATAQNVPGLVQAWECFERQTSWVLVMEKPDHSVDLFDVLAKRGTLSEDVVKIILTQVLKTCLNLARNGIFHRDIKDENILLNLTTLETKLLDFGCGDFDRKEGYDQFSGTVQFAPPEVHLGRYKSEPVTVWSIGALAHTLLKGDVVYETKSDVINRRAKIQNWQSGLSDRAIDFIMSCSRANPAHRPGLKQLTDHPFLRL